MPVASHTFAAGDASIWVPLRRAYSILRAMKLARKVCVIGVGMTKFHKPGTMDYPQLTKEAGEAALADAGIRYDEVQQGYVGFVYGDSTSGQRSMYQLGLTGIPIYN